MWRNEEALTIIIATPLYHAQEATVPLERLGEILQTTTRIKTLLVALDPLLQSPFHPPSFSAPALVLHWRRPFWRDSHHIISVRMVVPWCLHRRRDHPVAQPRFNTWLNERNSANGSLPSPRGRHLRTICCRERDGTIPWRVDWSPKQPRLIRPNSRAIPATSKSTDCRKSWNSTLSNRINDDRKVAATVAVAVSRRVVIIIRQWWTPHRRPSRLRERPSSRPRNSSSNSNRTTRRSSTPASLLPRTSLTSRRCWTRTIRMSDSAPRRSWSPRTQSSPILRRRRASRIPSSRIWAIILCFQIRIKIKIKIKMGRVKWMRLSWCLRHRWITVVAVTLTTIIIKILRLWQQQLLQNNVELFLLLSEGQQQNLVTATNRQSLLLRNAFSSQFRKSEMWRTRWKVFRRIHLVSLITSIVENRFVIVGILVLLRDKCWSWIIVEDNNSNNNNHNHSKSNKRKNTIVGFFYIQKNAVEKEREDKIILYCLCVFFIYYLFVSFYFVPLYMLFKTKRISWFACSVTQRNERRNILIQFLVYGIKHSCWYLLLFPVRLYTFFYSIF